MAQYVSMNPATGEIYDSFDEITDAELAAEITTANTAYSTWRATDPQTRQTYLRRCAAEFRADRDALAEIITTEMGKPITQALGEVEIVARIFEYYADNLIEFLADEPIETPLAQRAVVRTEAMGVLLGIMPWNFPYYQVARFAAPNIGLGNTILIKHARNCPRAALAFAEVLDRARAVTTQPGTAPSTAAPEVPEGVYANLFISSGQVEQILAHDAVRAVSLTGSEPAGAAVAQVAGRYLKKVVLELGGSDPFIVCESADIAKAAQVAAEGRLRNAGQVCTSSKRFFVQENVYDEFVAALRTEFASFNPGDPLAAETKMGPLSSEGAIGGLSELVTDAVAKGAEMLIAGGHCDQPGAFFSPVLLAGVTPEMRLYREEAFGPVAVIHKFASIDDAIAGANDSPYGLAAAVFTNDDAEWEACNRAIEAGMIWRNGTNKSSPELPFGGVKNSGFGRELSRLGFDEFANKKLVCEA